VILGNAFGARSPVRVLLPTVYLEIRLAPGVSPIRAALDDAQAVAVHDLALEQERHGGGTDVRMRVLLAGLDHQPDGAPRRLIVPARAGAAPGASAAVRRERSRRARGRDTRRAGRT
jgi:hypothetical protein